MKRKLPHPIYLGTYNARGIISMNSGLVREANTITRMIMPKKITMSGHL